MMNNKEIENLIAKHLSGETSPQEQNEFRLWLNSSEKHQEEFRNIALAHQLSKGISTNGSKSAVFSKIQQRIHADEHNKTDGSGKKIEASIRRWLSIAASIILILATGLFYYLNTNSEQLAGGHPSEMIVKSNPAGQKSKVFLPDGSIVWLNSESSVSFEKEFTTEYRHIHLKGEAFFEVVKDNSRPFVVYSGSISTTALGTAFDVNAFDEDHITVSLTNGKVNVETTNTEGENTGLIINAGEGVIYNPSNEQKIDKIEIDPEKVRLWRDGLLELTDASLAQTIIELERWYGVNIVLLNEPIQTWNANGLFDNEYLNNVLTSLSFSQGFEYEIVGKKVNITFK
jgi:ferric-dicitrate binding protein FerR (iron transport regulator)